MALRFFSLLTLLLGLNLSAHGQMTDRNDPLFRVDPELLEKGEVHYYIGQYTREEFKRLHGFFELDGARFAKRKGSQIQLVKLAYIVHKPAGFFSSTQMADPKWLQTILGGSVKTLQEDTFQTQSLGKMRVYFDSDDLSSVRTSRFVHAVAQSKKLDPIALSGFSTVVMHSSNKVEIHNHVPFTPQKTLVVSYSLTVVDKNVDEKSRRLSFVKETEARLARSFP